MKYRKLGRTGLEVSPLCLGAMMFGGLGRARPDTSIKIIHTALGAGVNFIDTADVYSAGESETIVGKAIKGRRDDLVIATKFHGPMGDDPNRQGNSRRWIMKACEESLTRLGTDHIDLYQVHRPEPGVDIEETLGALDDLVHQGKVRYLGSSTYPPSAIVEAQWAAERRNTQRFVCEQPPYSLLVRGVEAEVLPTCERYAMGVIAWSPLAGGWLSGRWRLGAENLTSRRRAHPRPLRPLRPRQPGQARGRRRPRQAGRGPGHDPRPRGPRLRDEPPGGHGRHHRAATAEHLDSQLGATDVVLDDELLDEIDKLVAPGTNFTPFGAGYVPPAIARPWMRRRARH